MRNHGGFSVFKKLLLILGVIWGAGVLTGIYFSAPASRQEPMTTPIIMQIRQLGQLHTVRYNVHDVLKHERHLEPASWARSLPGAQGLVEATTSNSVLLEAEGGIEAGVDLSGIGPESVSRVVTAEGTKVRVKLPRATIFEPKVNVRVVDRKSGLFWHNENIVPEAQLEAERRVKETASRDGILATAETNAIKTLSGLQIAAGNSNVEFYF